MRRSSPSSSYDDLRRLHSVALYLFFFGTLFLVSQSFLLWNLPALNDASTHLLQDSDDDDPYAAGYDIVTLVHHDDMATWLEYGLKSWVRHFLPFTASDAHIYAISSPKAFEAITRAKQQKQESDDSSTIFDRVIPVPESIFPFTVEDTKKHALIPNAKPTWVYQQLLKLFAYQVLSNSSSTPEQEDEMISFPAIKQLFLIMDSDTVAVRPMPFLTTASSMTSTNDGDSSTSAKQQQQRQRRRRPIYNIASDGSGAFPGDGVTGTLVVADVFKDTVPKAFPDHDGQIFTAITHHMMIDGPIMMEMLSYIEQLHNNTPALQVLCGLKNWLSEWELYMAWVMKHHREEIALKQIPYVNWGKCTEGTLAILEQTKDVFYLTKHDNFLTDARCCVNSNWDKADCRCCPSRTKVECGGDDKFIITCDVLGISGCRDDKETGLMFFDDLDYTTTSTTETTNESPPRSESQQQ